MKDERTKQRKRPTIIVVGEPHPDLVDIANKKGIPIESISINNQYPLNNGILLCSFLENAKDQRIEYNPAKRELLLGPGREILDGMKKAFESGLTYFCATGLGLQIAPYVVPSVFESLLSLESIQEKEMRNVLHKDPYNYFGGAVGFFGGMLIGLGDLLGQMTLYLDASERDIPLWMLPVATNSLSMIFVARNSYKAIRQKIIEKNRNKSCSGLESTIED